MTINLLAILKVELFRSSQMIANRFPFLEQVPTSLRLLYLSSSLNISTKWHQYRRIEKFFHTSGFTLTELLLLDIVFFSFLLLASWYNSSFVADRFQAFKLNSRNLESEEILHILESWYDMMSTGCKSILLFRSLWTWRLKKISVKNDGT